MYVSYAKIGTLNSGIYKSDMLNEKQRGTEKNKRVRKADFQWKAKEMSGDDVK